MDEPAVIARYDALLSSIGERAGDVGTPLGRSLGADR